MVGKGFKAGNPYRHQLFKAIFLWFFTLLLPGSSGLQSQWSENLARAVLLDIVDQFEQFTEASAGKSAVILEPLQVFKGQFMDGQAIGRVFIRPVFAKWHMGIADFSHGLGELFRINHRF